MIEAYLGRTFGRFLIQLAIVGGLLFATGIGFRYFFYDFMYLLVWSELFAYFENNHAITLDNIEDIITFLAIALSILILIVLVTAYFIIRFVRRYSVSQSVIDGISDLRAEGINKVLNRRPENSLLNDSQKDAWVFDWYKVWEDWDNRVYEYLKQHLTHAESMQFKNQGVIPSVWFPDLALTNEHGHYLAQLSKQLSTLDGLIQRHQDRR